MGNYTIFLKFENPRKGRQARNLSENDPKILDLKSSSEQIIFRKLSLGAPGSTFNIESRIFCVVARNLDKRKLSGFCVTSSDMFMSAMRSEINRTTRTPSLLCKVVLKILSSDAPIATLCSDHIDTFRKLYLTFYMCNDLT